MNFKQKISTLLLDRGDLLWSVQPTADVGYLGWLNRGNLGDEAMFEGHRQVSPVALRRVPMQSAGWRLAKRGKVQTLVLGGGTLLARREWTVRLEQAIEILRPERLVSLGVGVEEPEFALAKGLINEEELTRQASLLMGFDRVGVRGPRSVTSLESVGVKAEVLGDPALVLNGTGLPGSPARKTILLSLANVSDGYADGATAMRRQAALAAEMVAETADARLVGLAMEPHDRVALKEAMPSIEVVTPRSVQELVSLISGAELVIGERLHANIVAAAIGTKFVAIGYKPKTFDFVESLGLEASVLDSRDLNRDDLHVQAIAALSSNDDVIAARVSGLASRFREAANKELS